MTIDLAPRPSVAAPSGHAGAAVLDRHAGLYRIDPEATVVELSTRVLGMPLHGALGTVTGCIDVCRDLTRSRVSVTARTAGFSSSSTVPVRDQRIRDEVLEAERYPTLAFDTDRVEPVTDRVVAADGSRPLWRLVGTVKVRGTRHPLCIDLGAVHMAAGRIEFDGSVMVRRRHVGIGGYSALVGERLRITIRGRADRVC